MSPNAHLNSLLATIVPLQRRLAAHALYGKLNTVADIREFMQHHVFAVWDFMSLLKALQRTLTCVDIPWVPTGSAHTRRLINEIVLQEESDVVDGTAIGHFELYNLAMAQVGATTAPIERLIEALRQGADLETALTQSGASHGAAAFVRSTFDMIAHGKPHELAAAFTYGREDSIPAMFRSITASVDAQTSELTLLSTYFARHLELDEEDHGPKAIAMLCDLCGDSAEKWREAARAAQDALYARIQLWSAIDACLGGRADERNSLPASARRAPAREYATL